MAVIAQAVKVLDVPGEPGETLLGNVGRTQVYRLAALDPESLAKTLEEMGQLSPTTRLQVDKKNHAIIAYAPLADHVVIRSLVEKLDASERKFEVIQLRRLQADYVAGTVELMMVGEKPKEQRRPWYFFMDGGSSRSTEETAKRFRVDADVEHNRLLLWANPIELQEVHALLVKLGEIPPGGAARPTVRVLEVPAGSEVKDLLETIRRKWPALGPNKLILPAPDKDAEKPAERPGDDRKQPADSKGTEEQAPPKHGSEPKQARVPGDKVGLPRQTFDSVPAASKPVTTSAVSFLQLGENGTADQASSQPGATAPSSKSAKPEIAGDRPPIQIRCGPDGQLILSSPDTDALDRLEELVVRATSPSPSDFHFFQLKYALAYDVAAIIEDVFQEDKRKRSMPWWWFDDFDSEDKSDKDKVRLSKRRPLKILPDVTTNSILVMGADARQLEKIEEMLKFYDRAEPTEAKTVRKTEIFPLRYTKAKTLADTIKDVYRDLLSANDKALASSNQQQESRRERYWRYSSSDDDKGAQKMPTFKGLLSIGVDEVSNSLIVSAPPYLMESITKIIQDLDQAAQPQEDVVTVVRLGPNTSAQQVEETLSSVLDPKSGKSRAPRAKRPTLPTQPAKPAPHTHGPGQAGHASQPANGQAK